jgi:hypothetical protein
VNEILMMPRGGIHFLVEGSADSKFWRPRLAGEHVDIVHCEGRTQLLDATCLVARRRMANVIGVYDTDYDTLRGIEVYHPEYLARTDYNDLEVTLVASAALNALLNEFADAERVSKFESTVGMTLSAHVEKISREFGKLRYISLIRDLKVPFDTLSPYRFVSTQDWQLNLAQLHKIFCEGSGVSEVDLAHELSLLCPDRTMWAYSQGHDTLKILAIGLKQIIGSHQRSDDDLAAELRLAFTQEMLSRTAMYTSLKNKECKLNVSLFP